VFGLLKNVLKLIVPDAILAGAMIVRERWRLARLSVRSFAAEPLRQISRTQLEAAFQDDAISDAWLRDLTRIRAVMPYEDIHGGVCPGERRAIYHLIAFFKPRHLLEIGTHVGASTLVIAQSLASHCAAESELITGDILDVNEPQQGAFSKLGVLSPLNALRKLRLEDRVRFEVKPAQQLMATLSQKMDFIFLDGDHSAKAVYEELSAALDLLSANGVILLHDFYPNGKSLYPEGMIVPGPFVAAERVHREVPRVNVMPLRELPWETKQGVKKTSLALVTRL
jgi:predicted O-methyltransferase YrrM